MLPPSLVFVTVCQYQGLGMFLKGDISKIIPLSFAEAKFQGSLLKSP